MPSLTIHNNGNKLNEPQSLEPISDADVIQRGAVTRTSSRKVISRKDLHKMIPVVMSTLSDESGSAEPDSVKKHSGEFRRKSSQKARNPIKPYLIPGMEERLQQFDQRQEYKEEMKDRDRRSHRSSSTRREEPQESKEDSGYDTDGDMLEKYEKLLGQDKDAKDVGVRDRTSSLRLKASNEKSTYGSDLQQKDKILKTKDRSESVRDKHYSSGQDSQQQLRKDRRTQAEIEAQKSVIFFAERGVMSESIFDELYSIAKAITSSRESTTYENLSYNFNSDSKSFKDALKKSAHLIKVKNQHMQIEARMRDITTMLQTQDDDEQKKIEDELINKINNYIIYMNNMYLFFQDFLLNKIITKIHEEGISNPTTIKSLLTDQDFRCAHMMSDIEIILEYVAEQLKDIENLSRQEQTKLLTRVKDFTRKTASNLQPKNSSILDNFPDLLRANSLELSRSSIKAKNKENKDYTQMKDNPTTPNTVQRLNEQDYMRMDGQPKHKEDNDGYIMMDQVQQQEDEEGYMRIGDVTDQSDTKNRSMRSARASLRTRKAQRQMDNPYQNRVNSKERTSLSEEGQEVSNENLVEYYVKQNNKAANDHLNHLRKNFLSTLTRKNSSAVNKPLNTRLHQETFESDTHTQKDGQKGYERSKVSTKTYTKKPPLNSSLEDNTQTSPRESALDIGTWTKKMSEKTLKELDVVCSNIHKNIQKAKVETIQEEIFSCLELFKLCCNDFVMMLEIVKNKGILQTDSDVLRMQAENIRNKKEKIIDAGLRIIELYLEINSLKSKLFNAYKSISQESKIPVHKVKAEHMQRKTKHLEKLSKNDPYLKEAVELEDLIRNFPENIIKHIFAILKIDQNSSGYQANPSEYIKTLRQALQQQDETLFDDLLIQGKEDLHQLEENINQLQKGLSDKTVYVASDRNKQGKPCGKKYKYGSFTFSKAMIITMIPHIDYTRRQQSMLGQLFNAAQGAISGSDLTQSMNGDVDNMVYVYPNPHNTLNLQDQDGESRLEFFFISDKDVDKAKTRQNLHKLIETGKIDAQRYPADPHILGLVSLRLKKLSEQRQQEYVFPKAQYKTLEKPMQEAIQKDPRLKYALSKTFVSDICKYLQIFFNDNIAGHVLHTFDAVVNRAKTLQNYEVQQIKAVNKKESKRIAEKVKTQEKQLQRDFRKLIQYYEITLASLESRVDYEKMVNKFNTLMHKIQDLKH